VRAQPDDLVLWPHRSPTQEGRPGTRQPTLGTRDPRAVGRVHRRRLGRGLRLSLLRVPSRRVVDGVGDLRRRGRRHLVGSDDVVVPAEVDQEVCGVADEPPLEAVEELDPALDLVVRALRGVARDVCLAAREPRRARLAELAEVTLADDLEPLLASAPTGEVVLAELTDDLELGKRERLVRGTLVLEDTPRHAEEILEGAVREVAVARVEVHDADGLL